jgi:CHAT domain-containing protein
VLSHEIISLPSASTLAAQRTALAGRESAPRGVAVIADPVFEQTDERVKPSARSSIKPSRAGTEEPAAREPAATRMLQHLSGKSGASGGLAVPRLPYTRQEAESILAVARGAANLKAVNFEASRATVTGGELKQYGYVHFATHGYIDAEKPGLSAIVLSLVNERGEAQDGFLRAQEVYNLELPAELVVLSACETGLGKEVRGEGLIGFTRGFTYAGAERVIVSLWNVSDKGTAELMGRLYRGLLREGKHPAAALRAAQAAMLNQEGWSAPYYWAAFVQHGDW